MSGGGLFNSLLMGLYLGIDVHLLSVGSGRITISQCPVIYRITGLVTLHYHTVL